MIKKILLGLLIVIIFSTLYVLYYDGGKNYDETKIITAHGPEDMALDLADPSHPRIVISCSKRTGEDRYGKIQYLDINSNQVRDFSIKGYDTEPFRPHGIHLSTYDSLQHLYVISHEKRKDSEIVDDKILKFNLVGDELTYINTIASSETNNLLDRTNDLYVTEDGFIYSSNPSNVGYSKKPANVVVIRPDGSSDIVASGLYYPNGVYVENNHLYVATAQGNILYKYDLNERGIATEDSKEDVAEIVGGDNITKHGNKLIVAHHPKIYKFVLHSRWGFKSPSAVTSYDLNSGDSKIIYGPSAKDISASSTAIIHDGFLYVSQVIENYIIKVPLSDLNQ